MSCRRFLQTSSLLQGIAHIQAVTLLGFESILPNFLLNGAVTKVLLGSLDRKYLKSSTYYVYFDSNKSKTDFHSAVYSF